MFDPASVRFRGPLAVHAPGLWAALMRQSYTPLSARNQIHLAADLIWDAPVSSLDSEVVVVVVC